MNLRLNLNLIDQRRSSKNPQLWVAGCSFAHGFCLKDINQRYGQLVADHLNLPVSFLTAPGSGIDWAHDQLLRSDLKEGDTVLWGLTSINRYSFFDGPGSQPSIDGQERFVNAWNLGTHALGLYENVLEKLYVTDSMFYRHIRLIAQIRNMLKKLNIRLILAFIEELSIELYHSGLKEFLALNDDAIYLSSNNSTIPMLNWPRKPRTYLDYATDKNHPGPLQHQQWGNQIIEYLK
jgi:hypothetical protein